MAKNKKIIKEILEEYSSRILNHDQVFMVYEYGNGSYTISIDNRDGECDGNITFSIEKFNLTPYISWTYDGGGVRHVVYLKNINPKSLRKGFSDLFEKWRNSPFSNYPFKGAI